MLIEKSKILSIYCGRALNPGVIYDEVNSLLCHSIEGTVGRMLEFYKKVSAECWSL